MHPITNAAALSTTTARRDALDIAQAGLSAIETGAVVRAKVRLSGEMLHIGAVSYDLRRYRHVHVIGFGKASLEASQALERVLGNRLTSGLTVTNTTGMCQTIQVHEATHPRPSAQNVQHSGDIIASCEHIGHDDLVLVIVSGGGSAMLCWPASECDQGVVLYDAANRHGITIQELNVVRKHISALKGGGLAAHLYPATVVGLIFSDVPGAAFDMVASGPTYLDTTTVADAQSIIDKYRLGDFALSETPKEERYFKKVHNEVLVSNEVALATMAKRARELGYSPMILGSDVYDVPEVIVERMTKAATERSVVLVGGETRQTIPADHGNGGRNQHVAIIAAPKLAKEQAFAAIASDGLDNNDAAGAVVDAGTLERASAAGLDIGKHTHRFDERPFLEATGDLVFTGPTGENVSDLMVLVTP
jgi:hydroxypyruvate reductase/glycerate 2-kinase